MSAETTSSDNGIVDRRVIEQDQTRWAVTRFDDGQRLLTCYPPGGVTFTAHFNETQWHEFRHLVRP